MKTALTTLVALVFAGSVFAGEGDKDYGAKFQELDTDKSGTLSQQEVRAKGIDAEKFQKLDTDSDGVLSEEEFKAMKEHKDKARDKDTSGY